MMDIAATLTNLASDMIDPCLSVRHSAGAVYRPPEIQPAFWKGGALCTEPKPLPRILIGHDKQKLLEVNDHRQRQLTRHRRGSDTFPAPTAAIPNEVTGGVVMPDCLQLPCRDQHGHAAQADTPIEAHRT